jgi:hypothetical protein
MHFLMAGLDFESFCDLIRRLSLNVDAQSEQLLSRLKRAIIDDDVTSSNQNGRPSKISSRSRLQSNSKTDNFIPIFVGVAAGGWLKYYAPGDDGS